LYVAFGMYNTILNSDVKSLKFEINTCYVNLNDHDNIPVCCWRSKAWILWSHKRYVENGYFYMPKSLLFHSLISWTKSKISDV